MPSLVPGGIENPNGAYGQPPYLLPGGGGSPVPETVTTIHFLESAQPAPPTTGKQMWLDNQTHVLQLIDSMGAITSLEQGGGTTPPTPNLGPDLRSWIAQPGDQELVLPNGNYTAGDVTTLLALHASTAGALGGWLILRAQTQGGVTIDLSTTGFKWGSTSAAFGNVRVLFIGCKFINGCTYLNGVGRLRYWYCDFSFPASAWNAQYAAAGGAATGTGTLDNTIRNTMKNPESSAFRMSDASNQCDRIEFYGCDFHNIGDDALYTEYGSNITIRGCRFWDIYDHGLLQYTNPATGGTFAHSDAFQTEGGTTALVLRDCSLGSHVEMTTAVSSITCTIDNCWQFGSAYTGWPMVVTGGRNMIGTFTNIQWFGNGQYVTAGGTLTATPTYQDSAWDVLQAPNGAAYPPGLTVSGISHMFPSDVAATGGILNDLLRANYPNPITVNMHALNPANVWRTTVGHAYADYLTFFAGAWT